MTKATVSAVLLFACVWQARALTLEEAIRLGWRNAPQIEAQHEQYRLSFIDRWRRFVPNEPQLNYANNDDHSQEAVGLSETFAFPGKSPAFFGLDKSRERAQYNEWLAKRIDISRNVGQTYLDNAVAAAMIAIQKQNILDLEGLARTLRARYEAGQSAQAEVIGIDLQLRQLEADLAATEDRAAVASQKLKKLLGIAKDEDNLELGDDVPEPVVAELGTMSADALRAQGAEEVASASESLGWWQQMPDLTLGAIRNRYPFLPASPSGRERTWSYSASITLPILGPLHERTEARRAKSQAVIDRDTARLAAIAAEADRRDAAREYARGRVRLREIREKDKPMAEALMESTLSAYKSAKLGFAELVLARKTLSDLRAQDVQLRSAIIAARLRCLSRCEDQGE